MIRRILSVKLLFVILVVNSETYGVSGSRTGAEPLVFKPEEIAAFAKQVEKAVAARGARVFIVGRQGTPPEQLPEGIRYTHTGFGVYSKITLKDGRVIPGYAMYNLYQRPDDPGASHLVVDYPVDFFAGVYELKAGIIIPKPKLQQRLLDIITSDTYRALHNPRYSIISNPFNSSYQNCTEHTLDVINAGIYQTDNIRKLKQTATAYYTPQPVKVSPFKLMFGSIFSQEVSVSDHSGPVTTSTFTTIKQYLEKYGLADSVLTITPENGS
ncbi:MAG: DUF2145 domain-containing protein [Gammaproteobacteria bacterium]|nr:DUF2145 domain-containing protein [Gammaproteobacteria bacterium]